MSDSETDMPSAASITRAIRDTVIAIHKSGNDEDLTVKRVRARAEKALGLADGHLKNDEWKDKSKDMILKAVDQYCGDEPEPAPSPKKVTKPAPKAKAKPEPKLKAKTAAASAPRAAKRKAAAPAKKPQKRRKTTSSDDESDAALSDSLVEDNVPSDEESDVPKQPKRRQKNVVAEDSDEEDEVPQKPITQIEDEEAESDDEGFRKTSSAGKTERAATPSTTAKNDASDSEMSVLLDDSPVKNKRQKKSTEKGAKEPKGAKAKPKASKATKIDDDPDAAEIKRLQGWLVKCGLRKVWGKELANCDTAKEKIKHLKGMLSDVGMTGKYSVEKAARIKEQREFAKDLEAIQAGNEAWGEVETSNTGRPRRRAARPVQPVIQDIGIEDSDNEPQDAKDEGTDDDDDDDDDVSGGSGSDQSDDDVHGDEDEDSE